MPCGPCLQWMLVLQQREQESTRKYRENVLCCKVPSKDALMSIPDDGMSTKISDTPRKMKRAANRLPKFCQPQHNEESTVSTL